MELKKHKIAFGSFKGRDSEPFIVDKNVEKAMWKGEQKMLDWKRELKQRQTNPEWGKERLLAIINELDNRDTPDLGYIRGKLQAFDEFLEDVKKAQTIWKEEKLKKVV